jgi:hypothetical protein
LKLNKCFQVVHAVARVLDELATVRSVEDCQICFAFEKLYDGVERIEELTRFLKPISFRSCSVHQFVVVPTDLTSFRTRGL